MKGKKIVKKVSPILRFAPSPTGFLHVGGARTAIFNWLLARKTGGSFLLRIEDTDRDRSSMEAEKQILDSLKWLGLDWDGEVYFQSRHSQRHLDVAEELLQRGHAYRCFCTKTELQEKRQYAEKHKVNKRYDGTCRHLTETQMQEKLDANNPFSIRFKVPDGTLVYQDQVHGLTRVDNDTLDDFILVRPDGTPTYQLAVVTDDHDMGVTFVLRGDDHIANTNKQILIFEAMDWPVPEFAHIPLILGEDKDRLSKRHGATSLGEYKTQGVLPDALFNYLCLLGWSPGNDRELMSREELIEVFDISRINSSASVFDMQKLFWMNSKYIAQLPDVEIKEHVHNWLTGNGIKLEEQDNAQFDLLVALQQVRSKNLNELTEQLNIFFESPSDYDEKGVQKFFKKGDPVSIFELLQKALSLKENGFFNNVDTIETFIREFAESQQLSAAKVIHPLRMALTGSTASPGIFELVHILGKDKVIERLKNAIEFIKKQNYDI